METSPGRTVVAVIALLVLGGLGYLVITSSMGDLYRFVFLALAVIAASAVAIPAKPKP
jgi:hypothetical protein